MSALFVRTCLPYAGKPAALRHWAAAAHLPLAPEPARAAFLLGAPGQVFDATTPAGKLVLVSSDDGICSVIAERAVDRDVAAAFMSEVRVTGLTLRGVADRNDPVDPSLHHREYIAERAHRTWRVLLATRGDGEPDRAMLTAAPF